MNDSRALVRFEAPDPALPLRPIGAGDVLRRRKLQIATTFLLTILAVAAVLLVMPKQYESHMKVLVKNERAETVVRAGDGTDPSYISDVTETEVNTEMELLNTRNLLETVVAKTGLDQTERSKGATPELAMEKAVQKLQRDLKITPIRKANIIEVDYSNTNARLAAAVLSELSEAYLEAHLRIHGTPGSYDFFAQQAALYQTQLKKAEQRLAAFHAQDNIVLLTQQKDVMLQKSAESDAALLLAEATIREDQDRIADIRTQLGAAKTRIVTQSRTMSNQYSVERLSTMLSELNNKRTELLAKFRPDDRLVVEVQDQIKDTQAALAKAMNMTGSDEATDVNPVYQALQVSLAKEEEELAGAKARQAALTAQAAGYKDQLRQLDQATAGDDDLMRAQKEAEDNFLLYSKKAEEARIADSLDKQKIANIAIAETPTEAHIPSKPNMPVDLAVGVLFAGFLSLGVAFCSEYAKQQGVIMQVQMPAALRLQVKDGADLEEVTGLPVLATIYRP